MADDLCTCGEPAGKPLHHDTTGWCDRGNHDQCGFTLSDATGFHWWCVCSCHEPPVVWYEDFSEQMALATWHRARARRPDAGVPHVRA